MNFTCKDFILILGGEYRRETDQIQNTIETYLIYVMKPLQQLIQPDRTLLISVMNKPILQK